MRVVYTSMRSVSRYVGDPEIRYLDVGHAGLILTNQSQSETVSRPQNFLQSSCRHVITCHTPFLPEPPSLPSPAYRQRTNDVAERLEG